MPIASPRSRLSRRRLLAGAFAALAAPALAACAGGRADLQARCGYRVHLGGLHHPRAIAFAPDGRLFLAEAGSALSDGRVTSIDAAGITTVLHSGLPRYPSPYGDDEDVGLAGIDYLAGSIYGVIGQGEADLASFFFRVDAGGIFTPLANLKHQPVLGFPPRPPPPPSIPSPAPSSTIPTTSSTWPFTRSRASFTSPTPAPTGFSPSPPTAARSITWPSTPVSAVTPFPLASSSGPDRAVYHGLLSGFPYTIGAGVVSRIDAARNVSDFVLGLTMPIDVAWGPTAPFTSSNLLRD